MKKQKKDINDFFNAIRDGQIDANELTIRVASITNDFALEKTEALRRDFEKYFKGEQKIRNSILSLEEQIQIQNIYADRKDPHFSFCYKFEQFLKSIIARSAKGTNIEYESKLSVGSVESEKKSNSFDEIFSQKGGHIFIDALYKCESPVIDQDYNFIGSPKKDKGVICCWIKHLQYKGHIKKSINRKQLASVLNRKIKGLNLGADGKTFDNASSHYSKNYEQELQKICNLLP